jgi:thiol reductant ABC exporter CydC subunit
MLTSAPVAVDQPHAAPLTDSQLRRRLLRLARPVLPPLALSVACRALQLACGIGILGVAGWAVGRAGAHALTPGVPGVAIASVVWALVALSLAKGLLRYGEQFCGHLVAFKALARLRVYFYDALEPQAPAAVEGRSTGDLLSRVTKDVDRVEVFFAHTLAPAVTAVLVPAATVVWFALVIGPVAAAGLAAGLILAGLVVPALGRTASAEAAAAVRLGRGDVSQHVTDSVQGVREVLAFGHEARRLDDLDRRTAPIGAGLVTLGRWIAVRRGLNALVAALTLIAEVALLTRHGLDLPRLGLGLGVTVAAFPPVLAVEDFAADLQQAYASARRLFEITDAAPLVPDAAPTEAGADGGAGAEPAGPVMSETVPTGRTSRAPSATQSSAATGEPVVARPPEGFRRRAQLTAPDVEFRDVTFTYPAAGGGKARTVPALTDVSFTARGGEVTAIVGASGSGKSTVASLLARVWDPDAGSILLGGRDVRTYPLAQLRAEVAITPQRPYLFNDTLAANLRLVRPDADDAALASVLDAAGLTDWVAAEPDGVTAQVGEMGERLSGGQRQRVALARTLLAEPSVIVLDEATSQLDAETEARVLAAVAEWAEGRTVIMIAHRLATVAGADHIVVLDSGRVVQQGTYETLSARPGPFRDLQTRELA